MFVEINPQSAGNLKDGGFVTLTTPAGSVSVRVHFNDGIMPGVIGMVKGLGHTLNNRYVSGKGVNINELISSKSSQVQAWMPLTVSRPGFPRPKRMWINFQRGSDDTR